LFDLPRLGCFSSRIITRSFLRMSAPKSKSTSIPKKDFAKRVTEMIDLKPEDPNSFASQFQILQDQHQANPNQGVYTPPQKYAMKNRYMNVCPANDFRVKLIKDKNAEEGADYINASYFNNKKYIIAQAPVEESFEDFWVMVCEQKISLIVMLTKFIENGYIKADEYWPEKENSKTYGEITVTKEEKGDAKSDIVVIRHFKVTRKGQAPISVTHMHYVQWPDHGTPTEEVEAFTKFFDLYKDQYAKLKINNAPVLIHCSAGIGRSGVFVLIDTLVDMLDKTESIDIFEMVKTLRKHRPGAIQTDQQYAFIFEFIAEKLKHSKK